MSDEHIRRHTNAFDQVREQVTGSCVAAEVTPDHSHKVPDSPGMTGCRVDLPGDGSEPFGEGG